MTLILFSSVTVLSIPGSPGGGIGSFSGIVGTIIGWLNSIITAIAVGLFGFPPSWVVFPNFIWYALVPFLGIFTIVYGFLKELRIFKRTRWSIPVLAFLITFSTMPLRIFVLLVNFMFQFLGAWSVGIFGFIFFIGTLYYAKLRKADWGTAVASAQLENEALESARKDLKNLYEERSIIISDITDAKGKRLNELTEKLEKLDTQINNARAKVKQIEDIT